jgi:hypothetical protein
MHEKMLHCTITRFQRAARGRLAATLLPRNGDDAAFEFGHRYNNIASSADRSGWISVSGSGFNSAASSGNSTVPGFHAGFRRVTFAYQPIGRANFRACSNPPR